MGNNIELRETGKNKFFFLGQYALILFITIGTIIALEIATLSFNLIYLPIEIIKVLISFNIFLIAYSTYPQTQNEYLRLLGLACGSAGCFNFLHVIVYKLPELSTITGELLSTLSWSLYRLFLIITLIATFIAFFRRCKVRWVNAGTIILFLLFGAILILYSIIVPIDLSTLDRITFVLEYILLILSFFGIGLILKYRNVTEKRVYQHLLEAAISLGIACIVLTANLYLKRDLIYLLGHLGYLGVTYFLYRATVVLSLRRPYDVLFHRLEKANLELQERAKSLIHYNELLLKNQAFVHAYLKHIGESIIIANSQGFIEEFNPETERMFGYKKEEVLGKSMEILFPLEESFLEVLTQEKERIEIFGKRKDGSNFPVEISKSMFKDGVQGSHFIMVLRDITKRRENERLHTLWGKVFETAVFGAVVTDAEARIQAVNRGFTETTGYTQEEVLGQNPRILKSGRHGSEFYIKMWNDLLTCGYWEGEIWNKKKTGEYYPEWLTIRAIKDSQGQTTNYIAFFRDITQDIKLRQEVAAAGKIQRSSLRGDRETELYILKSIFHPYKYVSGDFFDYRFDKKNKLLHGFVLDVMGHGLATALQISAIRVLYRYALEHNTNVDEILAWINKESAPYFVDGSFCAAICFTMDFVNRKIHISSAGINKFLRLSQGKIERIKMPGLFLGVVKDEVYEKRTYDLVSGESWIFLTDGISDALTENDFKYMDTFAHCVEHMQAMALQNHFNDDATAMAVYVK